jgi:hypothetical protein
MKRHLYPSSAILKKFATEDKNDCWDLDVCCLQGFKLMGGDYLKMGYFDNKKLYEYVFLLID